MDLIQELRDKYFRAAIAGEHELAHDSVDQLLSKGLRVLEIYQQLFVPALQKVGSEWEAGAISISQEHLATQVTLDEMTLLRQRITPRPALNCSVVVATLPDDLHVVGARMVADFFYADGWKVEYLGGNTPPKAIANYALEHSIDVVLISASSPSVGRDINKLAEDLSTLQSRPMLIVGGAAIGKKSFTNGLAGVDLYASDPETALREARKHCGILGSEAALEQVIVRLGERIRKLRTTKCLSQQQLAQSAGIDRAYLSSIENGKKNPSLASIWRIAEVLEVPLSELLE